MYFTSGRSSDTHPAFKQLLPMNGKTDPVLLLGIRAHIKINLAIDVQSWMPVNVSFAFQLQLQGFMVFSSG